MGSLSGDTLTQLSRIDTPTICNAIELFGLRPKTAGYANAGISALNPDSPPAVGFASTATFRSSPPVRNGEGIAMEDLIRRFDELPGPPFVVIRDLDPVPHAAVFGEIMCSELAAFGAVALATNGAGRDVVQVTAQSMPVYASGLICARGYSRFLEFHTPVELCGVDITPGDILHGDGNGIVAIPLAIAHELVEVAGAYAAEEAHLLQAIRSEPTSLRLVEEARRRRSAVCARLSKQVRRDVAR